MRAGGMAITSVPAIRSPARRCSRLRIGNTAGTAIHISVASCAQRLAPVVVESDRIISAGRKTSTSRVMLRATMADDDSGPPARSITRSPTIAAATSRS